MRVCQVYWYPILGVAAIRQVPARQKPASFLNGHSPWGLRFRRGGVTLPPPLGALFAIDPVSPPEAIGPMPLPRVPRAGGTAGGTR